MVRVNYAARGRNTHPKQNSRKRLHQSHQSIQTRQMSNANTVVENMWEEEISVLPMDKVPAYVTREIIFPQNVRVPVRMSVNLILMTVVILNLATLSRQHMANNGLQKSHWRWMMQLVKMSYVSWILDQPATYLEITILHSNPEWLLATETDKQDSTTLWWNIKAQGFGNGQHYVLGEE